MFMSGPHSVELERHSGLQLHNPARKCSRSPSGSEELILNNRTASVKSKRREVQHIKYVKHIHSQLKTAALAKRRGLAEGHVNRSVAWSTE